MYWTKKHVVVCTASHCSQKGANDVIGRLRLEIVRKGLDTDILINNCGTIDLCDIGPNLVVYPDNVILRGVTVKDIPALIEYLKGGPVPESLRLNAETPDELQRKEVYVEAVATGQPWPMSEFDRLVGAHGLEEAWTAEQLRRGFLARKPDAETGETLVSVTKKARARYSV